MRFPGQERHFTDGFAGRDCRNEPPGTTIVIDEDAEASRDY
jgi:hypothetical protein